MSITINTNLSSLVVQLSMKGSTIDLNRAIERMTTGYKINSAKDDAAGYAVVTGMNTKISSYNVAANNVSMGLDMLATATDSLDVINNKLLRLKALSAQAANGTYGTQSLKALNTEAVSLINEIYRIRNNTVYNDKNVCGNNGMDDGSVGASGLTVNSSGFLQDIEKKDVSSMTSIAEVDETQTLAKGTYSISSAEELAKLATMCNAGKLEAGSEFVLGADIDLKDYTSGNGWMPIGGDNGSYRNYFQGVFDGNGYKITNLYTNRPTVPLQGLFGAAINSVIKNLGIESGDVIGKANVGGLIGAAGDGGAVDIINCYSKVNATGSSGNVGGLVGVLIQSNEGITNCYATGNILLSIGGTGAGGVCGQAQSSKLSNCFATGDITSYGNGTGGLVGSAAMIENCFATGDIYIEECGSSVRGGFGGLVGWGDYVKNSHATGNVTVNITTSGAESTGGLVGMLWEYCGDGQADIVNCYATGDVSVDSCKFIGGLIGYSNFNFNINNCFSLSNVSANKSYYVGGILGDSGTGAGEISNCYTTGEIHGYNDVGGIIGWDRSGVDILNCYVTGDVCGRSWVGGIVGYGTSAFEIRNCYVTGDVIGVSYVGGIIGSGNGGETVDTCYTTGSVSGTTIYGGIAGGAKGTYNNCYVLGKSTLQGIICAAGLVTVTDCKYLSYYEDMGTRVASVGATVSGCETYDGSVPFLLHDNSVSMQVGIGSSNYDKISFDKSFSLGNLKNIIYWGIADSRSMDVLNSVMDSVTCKQTEYGAMQNRLESALDGINVQHENLVSARSTVRDADVAKESAAYIKSQILQNASATLLATANQSPTLALTLIGGLQRR